VSRDPVLEGRAKLMRMRTEVEVLSETPGCESCVWYGTSSENHRDFGSFCGHPVYSEVKPNLIGGGVKLTPFYTPVDVARHEGAACGPQGWLYERKRWARTRAFWRRIRWEQVGICLFLLMFSLLARRWAVVVGPLMVFLYLILTDGILREKRK
jgi:hypothetical protein